MKRLLLPLGSVSDDELRAIAGASSLLFLEAMAELNAPAGAIGTPGVRRFQTPPPAAAVAAAAAAVPPRRHHVYACEMAPWKKVLGFKVVENETEGTVQMSCEAVIETMFRTYLKGQLTYDAKLPMRDVELESGVVPPVGDPDRQPLPSSTAVPSPIDRGVDPPVS